MTTGDITEAAYEAAIKRIVDAAPPLSDAQRDRLAMLLDDTESRCGVTDTQRDKLATLDAARAVA